jgi:catechol 2,3-dioxygenase-like lactoylglutathione lyase family enzyme
MKTRLVFVLVFLAAALAIVSPGWAELAAPNASGVSMGHIHLAVKDVDAERNFFILLGGVPVSNGAIQMIQFPGVFINIRQDKPSAGTVGSTVNHFGFHVQSVAATLEKIKPLGLKVEQNNPQQAFVTAPEDVRVELLEDKTISSPIEMHHIHMFVTEPLEVQAWYVKHFGAIAGKRGRFDTANIPGAELSFTKADMAQAPTKGRSLDHIGFEVQSLDETVKRLEADGIKMDVQPRAASNGTTKIAFLTDPWGTYIELTQGLAPISGTK